jgi:hypothetical protein
MLHDAAGLQAFMSTIVAIVFFGPVTEFLLDATHIG